VGLGATSATIPAGMLAETIPVLLLYAAAVWIALGATFGRPTPEL
jgi:hypothetical protein